jgi:hypothetical protein
MRTTVTLDPDVQALLKKAMRERGVSFKEALNSAIRDGLRTDIKRAAPRSKFRTPTFNMGLLPGIDLTKANQLAADLEDEEIIRKMNLRK